MRSPAPRPSSASFGAAATTVAALSFLALLTPARVHAQINGFNFVKVADDSGPLRAFFFSGSAVPLPQINASGQVAFEATLDTGEMGIFAVNAAGAPVTTVATATGQYNAVYNPSLNASGQIAFTALTSTGGFTPCLLYTSPSPRDS